MTSTESCEYLQEYYYSAATVTRTTPTCSSHSSRLTTLRSQSEGNLQYWTHWKRPSCHHESVLSINWGNTKRVTLVYLYRVNRCGHHKKLSIAKLDFVQVCGLSLNFYNNTLRKFYKISDSQKTWTSPTLQSADWPISRQYYRPQVRQRVSYPEI